MRWHEFVVAVLAVLAASGVSTGAEVTFAAGPTVTAAPEGVRVAFTASEPTDVEVAVLDAKGQVIRHLAAGLLGTNAPAPLRTGTLAQSILWDRTDGAGRAVPKGRYRVRVRLELGAAFERVVEWEPPSLASRGVLGFDVDEKGDIYAVNASMWHGSGGGHQLMVWNGQGRYLRQIMPIRRNVDLKRLPGIEFRTLPSGQKVPNTVYWPRIMNCRCIMLARNGRITMIGSPGADGHSHLVRMMTADGGAPPEGWQGPAIPGRFHKRFPGYLAASPDGKTFYVTGMGGPVGRVMNIVCRATWTDKVATTFIDSKAGLSDPRGLATDAKGRLVVCDFNHDRLAVFSPDGKPLMSLPVVGPEQVEIDRTTGAVYVYSLRDKDIKRETRKSLMYKDKAVVKYAGLDDWKEVARLQLPRRGRHLHDAGPIMALDTSARQPVIFISYVGRQEQGDYLWKIVDRGATLERVAAPIRRYAWPFIRSFCAMAVDREREEVYLAGRSFQRFLRLNGRTGELTEIEAITKDINGGARLATDHPQVTGLALDRQGRIYVRLMGPWSGWDNLIRRYDRAGTPVPFTKAKRVERTSIRLGLEPGQAWAHELVVTQPSRGYHSGGLAVAPNGDLYVIEKAVDPNTGGYVKGNANALNIYGPDGALKQRGVIPWLSAGAWGPRIDRAGNLYLTDAIKPNDPKATSMFSGSLVKYGPGGGRVRTGVEAGRYITRRNERDLPQIALEGAEWVYYGVGLTPFGHCVCDAAHFDLDGYGRSVVPDVNRHRVKVIDSAGNFLMTFGEYGNRDSAGPKSQVPVPAIPLWDPNALAVSDRGAYLYDRRNHRILCVTFTYAAASGTDVSVE